MSKDVPVYYEAVYDVVRLIPKGRVSTYGHIADFLALGSARMVGYALRQSLSEQQIPAHRVVNSQGVLTGMRNFRPPQKMIDLLEAEGSHVKKDKIQNFKEKLWIPSQELS